VNYPEAIDYLYSLRWFGAKLGLRNTFRLAELAGNPQERLGFIHVAGTNGKGSTCAMLESIYRAAGLRVGLFTSPHMVSFGERIQVGRRPLTQEQTVRQVRELQPLLRQFPQEEHPTFFEVVTVMALRHFAEQQCELVVWETGLGGRLDATNIVTPLLSIITNIQYDHQKWLGATLASIAGEKAGIIKPNIPAITGAEEPEALEVIAAAARERNVPLTVVPPSAALEPPLDTLALPLPGLHQKKNAALALAATRVLQPLLPVDDRTVRAGLEQVRWAGRMQLIRRAGGGKVLLDGAHNPAGAEVLARALQEDFPGEPLTLVLGILEDKDWEAMCRQLAPLARRILLVPVHSERTATPHGLAEVCQRANPAATVIECASLAEALARAEPDPFVTIAGSLYLVGEAMELLHLSPGGKTAERRLNEWIPGRAEGTPPEKP
jgi:dihydrofolate synthase / folylpolyglutamate synthase